MIPPYLLLLGLAASLSAQSSPPTWMLGHPNAMVLLGVDVRSLSTSPATLSLRSQLSEQMQKIGPALAQIPSAALLSDIDRVFLSSPGESKPPVQASLRTKQAAAPAKNPPFLMVIEGTFPAEHMRHWTEGPHSVYHSVNIYGSSATTSPVARQKLAGPPEDPPWIDETHFAMLDEHTIVLGDEKSLHSALDRRGTPAGPPKALLLRAAALAPGNDFWMVMASPSSALQEVNGPFAALISEVAGVDFGVSLRQGLALDANVSTKTAQGAQTMAQFLATQMEGAAAAQSGNPEAVELMRKLRVTSEGNQMRMHVELTPDELERQIRVMQASRQNAGVGSGGAVTRPTDTPYPSARPTTLPTTAPKALPNTPQTIKIYGLEGGVREIPMQVQKK